MIKHSAGILLFRFKNEKLEVMLVHPGGPFWAKKDYGTWSVTKGLSEKDENLLDAAKREFREETGFEVDGKFIELGEFKQPGRKIVHVWALQKDLDANKVVSNTFELEWPKGSGIVQEYPEVDKAEWFDIEQAKRRILKGQRGFLDRLEDALEYSDKKSNSKQTTLPQTSDESYPAC